MPYTSGLPVASPSTSFVYDFRVDDIYTVSQKNSDRQLVAFTSSNLDDFNKPYTADKII